MEEREKRKYTHSDKQKQRVRDRETETDRQTEKEKHWEKWGFDWVFQALLYIIITDRQTESQRAKNRLGVGGGGRDNH